VWSEQPLEQLLRARLDTLPASTGADLFSDYVQARQFVTTQIAALIGTTEPDLTDHSEGHLAEVMSRTYALIGDQTEYFSPFELCVLCTSILFHDVGNLHGRKDHHKKVARIYDAFRKREPRFKSERTSVLTITGAHTGSAKDGSKDTLKELDRLSFHAQSVRSREVAAVLRLADELAEGVQRTSAYMLNHGMYKPDATIFHKYASITDYRIERGVGRVALTYSIDIEHGVELEAGNSIMLKDLLGFSYKRIIKLDQERRYCKHYCDLLSPFKETAAWFSFWFEGQQLELDINPITISDLIVPGEPAKSVEQIDTRYEISSLVSALGNACGEKA
jgi:hypothetical protein